MIYPTTETAINSPIKTVNTLIQNGDSKRKYSSAPTTKALIIDGISEAKNKFLKIEMSKQEISVAKPPNKTSNIPKGDKRLDKTQPKVIPMT